MCYFCRLDAVLLLSKHIFRPLKTKVMKAVFYSILFIAMVASCKSVEKMVEKGEYDKAFTYAISKLRGEKNKKTEHVKGLEKAYAKLNSANLKEIGRLNPEAKPANWVTVLNLYKNIENRQDRIEPLLPLVSEDGYRASFDIINVSADLRNAEENTILYHYNKALDLIDKSERTKDKLFARDAYDELGKIDNYRTNYKDKERLKEKALNLGLTRIYFDVFNGLRDFHGNDIEKDMWNLPVSKLDNLWNEYSIGGFDDGKDADFVVIIELENINFSPEKESVNSYKEEKEILIRKEIVKEKRDSVMVDVEKEVWEKVKANISEILREKKSELHGKMKVFDNKSKEYISSVPINVYDNFSGYACNYVGDERALTPESKRKMDAHIETFPSDFSMASNLSAAFGSAIMNQVKKVKF